MSKLKAPCLSLGASKSIGKALTFRKDKRQTLGQIYFKPTDIKTADQLSIRTAIDELQNLWQTLTATEQDSWNNYAKEGLRGRIPGYNAFLKHNFAKYHNTGAYDVWANYDLKVIDSTGREVITSTSENIVVNMGD